MAAKGKGSDKKPEYSELVSELRKSGPERIYLLWGEEDYLRERFFDELKKLCLEGGEGGFNHHRFDGASVDLTGLSGAIDTPPFFAERTLVELRGFNPNKFRESAAETLKEIFSDIPDYCTVAIIPDSGFEPDGRLAAVKTLKKYGSSLEFAAQGQSQLINWITRRVSACGKSIGRREAEHLVFVSGGLMNRLIPEIDKVAAYAKGESITAPDIDAVAIHIPETEVFRMTDMLSAGDYDGAARVMSELLDMKEHPIMLLAVIGQQLRKLYAARVAMDEGLGDDYINRVCEIKYSFLLNKLKTSARRFTQERLARAVTLCAETDMAMKSSSQDDEELLKELLIRLAAGGEDG